MNVKEEKICRLCLKVAQNEFEIIDEITKKIFEVLLLKVNLDISEDPVICKDCSEVAAKCFNFKSAFIDAKIPMTELEDVYKDGKDKETIADNMLCRFCSKYLSGNNFILLDTLMTDVTFAEMLQQLLPDMDINMIKNPVICTPCREDLECYIKFVENCTDVEEKITTYFQNEGAPSSGQVKLNEILRFFNKNVLEFDYIQLSEIKQEEKSLEDVCETHSEVYDGELINSEEEMDIKDEEINFSDVVCKTSSNTPGYQMLSTKNITEVEMYKCSMCTYETIYKGSLKRHMLIHKDITEVEMYKCSMCTFETKHKKNLTMHMLLHKNVTELEMYKCSMCTYETKHKNGLKRHILIHKDITETETYKCSMCTFETKHKCSLKRHTIVHKDITEVKRYTCSMCTFETKHKKNVTKHMLIHKNTTELEMYKCSMCTYETKHKGGLKRHILIHKDITKRKCYLKSHEIIHKDKEEIDIKYEEVNFSEIACKTSSDKSAYQMQSTTNISKAIHKDIKEGELYKCSMCTLETKHKKYLTMHMLIHKNITELEMYKCAMCTFETKHKRSLKRHMLTHKDITEVETYTCSMCTFETKYKKNLTMHMLIHKDVTELEMYKCSMCTYETKHKGGLKRHILIHKDITEVEMYKCSICTYQAKQKSHLQTHMLTHKDITEVEMYKCSMCTYETIHKSSLKRHMFLIHKDNIETE